MRRRLSALLAGVLLPLIVPAVTWAATTSSTNTSEKPTGHDWTLTTIFVVAFGIPLLLTILTLIDIAVGKHTTKQH